MNNHKNRPLSNYEIARARLNDHGPPVAKAMSERMRDSEIALILDQSDSPRRASTGRQMDSRAAQGDAAQPQLSDSAIYEIVRKVLESFEPVIAAYFREWLRRSKRGDAGAPKTSSRSFYERDRSPLQRYGQREFDESKHPRAPAGRADGGQFVAANGGFKGPANAKPLNLPPARPQVTQIVRQSDIRVENAGPLKVAQQLVGHGQQVQRSGDLPPRGKLNVEAPPAKKLSLLDGVNGLVRHAAPGRQGSSPVARGIVNGLGQSFIVDGLFGTPLLAYELSKSGVISLRNLSGQAYAYLKDLLSSAGRQVAGRFRPDDNKVYSEIDAALAKAWERARKTGGQAEFLLRMGLEIRRLDLSKLPLLLQSPEFLEGHVSDEFLLLAVITQDTVAELSELAEDAVNMDAEQKAYLASYLFGTVLYEVAELYATRAATLYTKSAKFGRLLKKLEKLPFIKNNPRTAAVVERLTERIFRLFGTEACFVAGTKVHTPDGLVNIEDLKTGDLVLSRDEKDIDLTGQIVTKPVVRPIATHPRMLWHISVRSVSGKTEVVVTTASHPFFVLERAEFVAAAALQIGQTLVLSSGERTHVVDVRVQHAAVGKTFTTFNLEIADSRTFFVGVGGLWVHNTGRLMCELIDTLYDRYRRLDYTDAQAKAAIWTILDQRMASGRLTREAAVTHWNDACNALAPIDDARRPSFKEARRMGLTERDARWPWRGLHLTEEHHPLMQGQTFRPFWRARGFSNREIENFTVKLDKDIHGAISATPPGKKPWWDTELFKIIREREKRLQRKLTKTKSYKRSM